MKSDPPVHRGWYLWNEWVRPLAVTAVIIFMFRSAVADWNQVPTGSMKPTIVEGDRVFVNRLAYDLKVPFTTLHLAEWSGPLRGDVIVFYSPADGQRLVKRVVGLPGDILEMRDNRLLLNGRRIDYDALPTTAVDVIPETERPWREFAEEELPGHAHAVMAMPQRRARRSFGPIDIPKGEYFVMGDSRDDSFDSRYFGCVPRRLILGRATAVVASLDPAHHWAPRWSRWFTELH